MFYKTGVFLCFSVMILPCNLFQMVKPENRELTLQRKHVHEYTSLQSSPVLLALQDQTAPTEKQQSSRSEKDPTATEKKKDTSPQQNKKRSSSKGFVPTEKIKADKAVDFPSDI